MPMNFPDMDSLKYAAQAHEFREPEENETIEVYREKLADFVLTTGHTIESMEIRTGKGWDQFTDEENRDMLTRGNPAMSEFLDSMTQPRLLIVRKGANK